MARYDRRRAAGTYSRPIGQQSEAQLRIQDQLSEAAERWLAAYLGADQAIIDGRRPDRGHDLIVPRTGQTLDVKHTRERPGERFGALGVGYPTLKLSTWKRTPHADLYALVCGSLASEFDANAWAFGWCTLDELLAAPITPGQYGRPYHWIGFDYLHPLDALR